MTFPPMYARLLVGWRTVADPPDQVAAPLPNRPFRFEVVDAEDGEKDVRAWPVTQDEYDGLVAQVAALQHDLDAARGERERSHRPPTPA